MNNYFQAMALLQQIRDMLIDLVHYHDDLSQFAVSTGSMIHHDQFLKIIG